MITSKSKSATNNDFPVTLELSVLQFFFIKCRFNTSTPFNLIRNVYLKQLTYMVNEKQLCLSILIIRS